MILDQPSPLGQQPSLFDPTAIEEGVRQVQAVEKSWRLPELPNQVKLELAQRGSGNVSSFMYGLESDLLDDGDLPTAPGVQLPTDQETALYAPQGRTWQADASKIWADVRTAPVPTELDVSAPARMKAAMVDKGLLPEGTPLDDSWGPQYQDAKYDLLDREYSDRIAGDKTGGVSVNKASSLIDDWLSPSGLLQAATELDLFWDFKAIGHETADWGNKFRKLGHSKNPFDFAKNFVDAVTGPIDDLVIPVVNWGLMFTGVSEATMTTKLALGAKAVAGAGAVDDLYQAGRFAKAANLLYKPLRAVDAAADFERMGEASWLASRLQRTENFAALGDKMAAWRKLGSVKATKKWVQAGMRMGVASRVEDLLPSYQGASGEDLPGLQQINQGLGKLREQPFAQTISEAMFTPYSIFEPGSITGALKAGTRQATEALAYVSRGAGRAGEGIQAVTAGRFGEGLAASAFRTITQDQALTAVFHEGLLTHLSDKPEVLNEYTRLVQEQGGVVPALKEFYGLTDDQLGAAMSYATVAAALDHRAAVAADYTLGATRDSRWWTNYHKTRNSLVGQIRGTDLTNDEDVIWRVAAKDLGSRSDVVQRFKDLKEAVPDMDLWRGLGQVDNKVARETVQDLLSTEKTGFGKDVLAAYLPQVLPTFGNWDGFVRANKEVQDLDRSGLLLNMVAKGRQDVEKRIIETGGQEADWIFLPTSDGIDGDVLTKAAEAKNTPLTKHVNRGTGKPTVMRGDGLTKQDILVKRREIQKLVELDNYAQQAKRMPKLKEFMNTLSEQGDVSTWDAATVRNLVSGDKKKAGLAKAMQQFNVNPDQLGEAVANQLAEAERMTDWRSYGVDTVMRGERGESLAPGASLKRRVKLLRDKANRTATEIDLDHMIRTYEEGGEAAHATRLRQLKGALDDHDYKLVYGQEFMAPTDLLDSLPFANVTQQHLRGARFNAFWERKTPQSLAAMRDRYVRESVGGILARHGHDEDLDGIMERLNDVVHNAIHERSHQVESTFDHGSWTAKRLEALHFQKAPKSIEDLALGPNRKMVVKQLETTYGPDKAALIWEGLKRSKVRSFGEVGLYALEAKLRASNLADILHGASSVKGTTLIGAAAGAMEAPKDSSLQEKALYALGGAGLGAVAGATVGRGVQGVASKIGAAAEGTKWARYLYLPDNLANARDYLRFSLNPFLDLQRYSEGWFLGATQKLPEGVQLPLSDSVRAFKKSLGGGQQADEKFSKLMDAFRTRQTLNGVDAESLTSVSRWATDVGLMGYIPEQKMAVRFAQLQAQGVSPDEAYRIAREIYTYGVTGRSSAELSANFILFPFSYQKKFLGTVGRWATDDMSRLMMMHDSLKVYHYLDDKLNLNDKLERHMPILQSMAKFNPLQFGFSAGTFGGVNAPFLTPILEGFIPHVFNIKTADDATEAKDVMRRMLPVWGDIVRTKDALFEQEYAAMSPTHQAKRFDVEEGWDEWNTFREQVNDLLATKGYSWADMRRNPGMTALSDLVDQRQIDITRQHPAWGEAKQEASNRASEKQAEKAQRLFLGEQWLAEHPSAQTRDEDALMVRFDSFDRVLAKHFDVAAEGEVPPEMAANMRKVAVDFATENPGFAQLYRHFYENRYGPIAVAVNY